MAQHPVHRLWVLAFLVVTPLAFTYDRYAVVVNELRVPIKRTIVATRRHHNYTTRDATNRAPYNIATHVSIIIMVPFFGKRNLSKMELFCLSTWKSGATCEHSSVSKPDFSSRPTRLTIQYWLAHDGLSDRNISFPPHVIPVQVDLDAGLRFMQTTFGVAPQRDRNRLSNTYEKSINFKYWWPHVMSLENTNSTHWGFQDADVAHGSVWNLMCGQDWTNTDGYTFTEYEYNDVYVRGQMALFSRRVNLSDVFVKMPYFGSSAENEMSTAVMHSSHKWRIRFLPFQYHGWFARFIGGRKASGRGHKTMIGANGTLIFELTGSPISAEPPNSFDQRVETFAIADHNASKCTSQRPPKSPCLGPPSTNLRWPHTIYCVTSVSCSWSLYTPSPFYWESPALLNLPMHHKPVV